MNNPAAIGYMIIAAKKCGLSKAVIQQLESAMYNSMDMVTENEAEDAYNKF